jgi:hypothetical protein
MLMLMEPGHELICTEGWRNCNRELAVRVTILVVVLGSALWHLVLLIPARNKESAFVRWHGRQALLLAGVRTAVPLVLGLAFEDSTGVLLSIPVLIIIWLFGTLWGQRQAARGDCSLMRWRDQEDLRAALRRAEEQAQQEEDAAEKPDPEALVEIIRFSDDPEERRKALLKLDKLGMVERL